MNYNFDSCFFCCTAEKQQRAHVESWFGITGKLVPFFERKRVVFRESAGSERGKRSSGAADVMKNECDSWQIAHRGEGGLHLNSIFELIQQFQGSNDEEKIQILIKIEQVCDEKKWPFLCNVFTNRAYDGRVRRKALAIISGASLPDRHVKETCGALIQCIKSDENSDLRNEAVQAMAKFTTFRPALEAAAQLLLNRGEDADIRWNAFKVISTVKNSEFGVEVLSQLLTDPVFRKSAQRELLTLEMA